VWAWLTHFENLVQLRQILAKKHFQFNIFAKVNKMKKYVAEWSFQDGCLKIYNAMGFFTGMASEPVYRLEKDGFYSNLGKVEFSDFMEKAQFYDEITNDTLVYIKGTYFNNMLLSESDNRLMSFFETLLIAFRQVGLVLDDNHIEAICKVYPGFEELWSGTHPKQITEGKLISFKIEEIKV